MKIYVPVADWRVHHDHEPPLPQPLPDPRLHAGGCDSCNMVASMKRWTPQRKEEVVAAYRCGNDIHSLAFIHDITEEEIRAWDEAYRDHGLPGLCVTKRTK